MFKAIENKRTFEEVSIQIKALILDGVLKPGDMLPSEIELASKFQVGRQSVREALRLLELSGFIEIKRGVKGGPVIKNTILDRMINLFTDSLKLQKISLDQLREARVEIEKAILICVFRNADNSDIKKLKANISESKKKTDKKIPAFKENMEFHRLLAKASKNSIFQIIIDLLMAVAIDFRSRSGKKALERSQSVTQHHKAILDAIIQKDRKKGLALMEEHMTIVRDFKL